MTATSHAAVVTDRPERYAKQLLSHLGRKAEVREGAEGSRLMIAGGSCLVVPGARVLDLHAEAPDAEALSIVQDVVGRHLVRFGDKDELVVDWTV